MVVSMRAPAAGGPGAQWKEYALVRRQHGRLGRRRGSCTTHAATSGSTRQQVTAAAAAPADYSLLGVPRGSSRRQIRAAYIERIKLLHPDVSASVGEDTTEQAAALNAAYERLMSGFDSNSRDDESDDEYDPLQVFDFPEAEPDRLFVNPFQCYNISPLQWEALQEAARQAEAAQQDPWYALQQQGVQCSEGAFVYLSPQQLAIITQELEGASATLDPTSMEVAAFFITECLLRARVGNSRMPSSRAWA